MEKMNQTIQEMREEGYYLDDVVPAGGGGGNHASIYLVFRDIAEKSGDGGE